MDKSAIIELLDKVLTQHKKGGTNKVASTETVSEREKRKGTTVHTADIVRSGDKITLPMDMTYDAAIEVLSNRKTYEEEKIAISESIDAYVWDGAIAAAKAMEMMFGVVFAKPTPGMFGPKPPAMISIECGVGKSVLVPWGRFEVPGVSGWIETTISQDPGGRSVFALRAEVKRKFEPTIHALAEQTRAILKETSIYRGKAIRMRFTDENGGTTETPYPRFVDLSHVRPEELLLPDATRRAVDTNLFTPLEKLEQCRKYDIPRKRGVLLEGPYGVGKTLSAYVAAKVGTDNGWTFLYVENAADLAQGIDFAKRYQPCVVFCEDIDRATSGDERTVPIDELLNIIDGIESKNTEIMVVMSTNHVDSINRAMLRPGRLDAIIEYYPPDAVTVERLLTLYSRGHLERDTDLTAAAEKLTGQIPAVIRECVERAKLSALKLSDTIEISGAALHDAAISMQGQISLLRGKTDHVETPAERVGRGIIELVTEAQTDIKRDLALVMASL